MKSIYYVASSLDGFIADPDGGVDWLDEVSVEHSGSGYESFYSNIDGLMMGRGTWDFVYNYGSWPYDSQPCWVVTSRSVDSLDGCNLRVESDPGQAWREAEAAGIQNLWVIGGGKLVSALMQTGLLSHIQVTVMPIVLGDGIRLVDSMPSPRFLQQESVTPGAGCVEIVYRVNEPAKGG